jgi:hypothetical protein
MTNATLGTWTNGTNTLVAAYFDADAVRLDNGRDAFVVSADEWLDRLDALKDAGWHKA